MEIVSASIDDIDEPGYKKKQLDVADSDKVFEEDDEDRLKETDAMPSLPYYIGQEISHMDSIISSVKIRDNTLHACSLNGFVQAWKLNDLSVVQKVELVNKKDPSALLTCMEVLKNQWLIGSSTGTVSLWNQGSGVLDFQALQHHSEKVSSVKVSGDLLFSTGFDGFFRAIDMQSQDVAHSYSACRCSLAAMCVVSDKQVWIGSWDGKMRLIDLRARDCNAVIHADDCGQSVVRDMALDAVNNRIFAAHGLGHISAWDVRVPTKTFQRYPGHKDVVNSIQVTSNRVYSGSDDQQARVFDVNRGLTLDRISGHVNGISTVCIEDNALVTGSFDCSIRRYDIATIEAAIDIRQRRMEMEKAAAGAKQSRKIEEEKAAAAASKKGKKKGKGKGSSKGKKGKGGGKAKK